MRDGLRRRATPWTRCVTTALLWNDARALFPIWAAGVAAAAMAGVTDAGAARSLRRLIFVDIHAVSLVVCLASIIGLGAQAFGHVYSHRTISLSLMMPVSRRRLFLVKQVTLAAMLLPLIVWLWLLNAFDRLPALLWLAAGTSLWLAPVWTMLCRTVLAGAVFSAAVPGLVFAVISLALRTLHEPAEADRAAVDVWTWLMLAVLPVGGVVAWRLFMRLEAMEERAGEVSFEWLRRRLPAPAPAHPVVWLLKKELRLQQMSFALTVLFVIGSTGVAMWDAWMYGDRIPNLPMQVASAIYWLALPVLIGALATAEERHLGTLAWQLQLPAAARLQWTVKMVAVFGLAILLAVVTPAVLTRMLWSTEHRNIPTALLLATVTTAASVYISSLCTSGVRAAMASLAAIPIGLWLAAAIAFAIRRPPVSPALWSGRESSWMLVTVLLVLTLVTLAFVNHRPDPPPARRVWRQSLAIAALLVAGIIGLELTRF
jgi:hypothetical protein